MSSTHRAASSQPPAPVLGVAFLVLLLAFGWLTYAIFNKSFASYDDVHAAVLQDRPAAARPVRT